MILVALGLVYIGTFLGAVGGVLHEEFTVTKSNDSMKAAVTFFVMSILLVTAAVLVARYSI